MATSNNLLSNSESWNLVAENYGEMANWVMTGFAKKALELVPVDKSANVIDVACGTGILTCMISKMVKNVHAVDFSTDMLLDLYSGLTKKDIHNVDLTYADGQNLPFKDNFFDNAFSLFGLMFFADRNKGFSEIYRVLKPNGVAIISSWAPIEKSTFMQIIRNAIKAVLPNPPSLRVNSGTLENPELFKSEMQAAGFHSVTIHEVTLDLPEISPDAFWKIMSEGGVPIALLKQKYSALEWGLINEKIIQYLHSTFSSNAMNLATTAYFGVGKKSLSQPH